MVTNLLPQILFDAFNLAILIVFYLHTTQAMFKIDHSLRICDLLKSHLHILFSTHLWDGFRQILEGLVGAYT